MLRKLIIFLSLVVTGHVYSAVIEGFAPGFVGKAVTVTTYTDYLTMTRVKIGEGEVNPKDSVFKIELDVKQTIKAFIEIGNTEAELYLAPDKDYRIFYKANDDAPVTFARQKASTYFVGLDTSDINYKILRYNNWFDEYLYVNSARVKKHGFAPYIDTFKLYAYKAYAYETDPYFVNYIRFNIANLELTKEHTKYMRSKISLYREYIEPYPAYPYHDEYMSFIKSFYVNDINSFHTQVKSDIILAFDDASPTRLMTAMQRDPLFQNEELRQLIMVDMLGNAYYKRQFSRQHIKIMLDSVSRFSKYRENGIAAKQMIDYVTKIEVGYPAPELSLVDNHDEVISWSMYKGKFIYIHFFTTWNPDALKEVKLMEDLYDKFSDYIEFVSFCMDKDSSAYLNFVNEHQNISWPVIYVGEEHQIIQDFEVSSTPYYLLLDQEGFIAMSPARGPSPDGSYETIERTFYFIKARMLKSGQN